MCIMNLAVSWINVDIQIANNDDEYENITCIIIVHMIVHASSPRSPKLKPTPAGWSMYTMEALLFQE